LFEGLILSEALKVVAHGASPARLSCFATPTSEVDLLVEANGRTLAVEIKSGQTVASDWFKTLAKVASIPAAAVDRRLVVYGGDEEQQRTDALVCPWWLFPVRLAAWLENHDAAPYPVDLAARETALRWSCQR
jgi:hypothetical protein